MTTHFNFLANMLYGHDSTRQDGISLEDRARQPFVDVKVHLKPFGTLRGGSDFLHAAG